MRFIFQSNPKLHFFSLEVKHPVHQMYANTFQDYWVCPIFFESSNVRREKLFVEILTCLFIGFVNSFSLKHVLKETWDFTSKLVLLIKVIRNEMVTVQKWLWIFIIKSNFGPQNCQECEILVVDLLIAIPDRSLAAEGAGSPHNFLSYLDKFSDMINKMMWICPTEKVPGLFQTGGPPPAAGDSAEGLWGWKLQRVWGRFCCCSSAIYSEICRVVKPEVEWKPPLYSTSPIFCIPGGILPLSCVFS